MIALPQLMIGEDLPRLLELHANLVDSSASAVECNASQLMTADPVGICLLAAAFHRLTNRGQRPRIVALRPEVYAYLRSCDVLSRWLDEPRRGPKQNPTRPLFLDPQVLAQMVSTQTESNRVANALTKAISRFLPAEDTAGVHSEEAGVARYLRIEQPVSYLMTELLDNALNHARAGGFRDANAWVAGQYFAAGDLVKLCVLDDGCGFLESLKSHPQVIPRNDVVAIQKAFTEFISCKKDVRLYKDSAHQGIGLTVCRDICGLADGNMNAASGSAWVRYTSTPDDRVERVERLRPGFQGSIISMQIHRRGLTAGTLASIVRRYQPSEDLPIRFF